MVLKVLIVFGTRPEAIKLAPVIHVLQQDGAIKPRVCVTRQHGEMLAQALDLFKIDVDIELKFDVAGLSISQSLAVMLSELHSVLVQEQPDVVLVQGDTTSCMAGALSAFYNRIPLVHIEAGLRTENLLAPYPEEGHRQMVSRIADLHMVPTVGARDHLLRENISSALIHVTGNTVIDALRLAHDMFPEDADTAFARKLYEQFGIPMVRLLKRMVVVTLHRRESIGAPFLELCGVLARCATQHPDWSFVYPVHLNPLINRSAHQIFEGISNIYLLPPQDYLTFVWLLSKSSFVVTDSGGVQEESEALGKPALIVRNCTDRPETLRNKKSLVTTTNAQEFEKLINLFLLEYGSSPITTLDNQVCDGIFGDGYSAQKIVNILKLKYGYSSSAG